MNKNIFTKIIFGAIIFLIGLTLAVPLAISNDFFFPFIFPKALAFRILVEVIFVLYFLLAYLAPEFRPKFNWLFGLLAGFIAVAFVAAIFGVNFYTSFWGDIERSEGLILWLHLLAYFLVLISILKEKHWLWLFNYSLIIGLIISLQALAQAFNLGFVENSGGTRVTAMFGNASFLAAYILFDLAIAAYLFLKKKEVLYRIIYALLFFLFIFVIINTQTRGAFLGLVAAAFVGGALLIFYPSAGKKLKIIKITYVSLIILAGLFIYIGTSTGWLRNYPALSRITHFSLADSTVADRLVAWQAGWQGWTETPKSFLLGYGPENYGYIFDKYFPPSIYKDEGSQVWFDRAHNVIFDRGVTTGAIGLGLYLLLIFCPAYFLFKAYRRGDIAAGAFIALIAAFFVQNLFVFETITTYVTLIFVWAFLAGYFKFHELKFLAGKNFRLGLFILAGLLLWPVMNIVNIKPAQANIDAALATNLDPQTASFFEIVKQYQKAIEINTYGRPEYQIQLIDYVGQKMANQGEAVAQVVPIIEYTDQQVVQLLSEQPKDSKNYLVAMRNYNYTFASLKDKKVERLNKALSYFSQLKELSPTRPQIYREAGLSNLYLFRYYKELKQDKEAHAAAAEAEKYFQKSLELNPKVYESNVSSIMCYLNTDNLAGIKEVLKSLDENGVDYKNQPRLSEFIQLAINAGNYPAAVFFNEELVKILPDNIEMLAQLAKLYAVTGDNAKAIATAELLRKIPNGLEAVQIDEFIKAVKAGTFKKK